MKFASPRGFSNIGIKKVILAEIDALIQNYEFVTFQHREALMWIRERLESKLEK